MNLLQTWLEIVGRVNHYFITALFYALDFASLSLSSEKMGKWFGSLFLLLLAQTFFFSSTTFSFEGRLDKRRLGLGGRVWQKKVLPLPLSVSFFPSQ